MHIINSVNTIHYILKLQQKWYSRVICDKRMHKHKLGLVPLPDNKNKENKETR